MKKILIIGSFITDLVVKSERFVEEGETIIGESFHQFTGGKGANQAIAAAKLGGNVEMIGKLGADKFGEDQIKSLRENNVKHDNVLFTNTASSGIGNPHINAQGQNRIVIIPGANSEFSTEDVQGFESAIRGADILVLQLELPLETVYEAITIGNKYGKTIILNPAPAAELDPKYAPFVTYIAPNEHEAAVLTDIDTSSDIGVREAASNLLEQGYQNVIITLGQNGSYFKNKDSELHIPAFSVSPVDVTAAGDTYIGALAYGLAQNSQITKALTYASAAASLSVTKMGAQPSLPTKSEIDQFLEKTEKIKK
ncbi:MAG: ribokinase [Staphylococcus equorum]|uniref:Ribokinase n=1 Tax=Tetragenococcus halophilus TaxID=51669 RepID=A0A3G5FHN0_TETHA|nr:ribokinase [Tetragenococcus halophilus]MDN6161821.1 ribokinase [Atopostipes sp.]MDN6721075.1 ribokinase [Staphylococcus equorum]MDN6731261.1 ribokinase [Atopostipes suicloacalis]AYW49819.1 ribokinase [Tetragenococcus halophilus]GBD63858.1 hypothetical protein TEHD23766T_1285 [Tetragenococcus halophilus subsp. flandriensis]